MSIVLFKKFQGDSEGITIKFRSVSASWGALERRQTVERRDDPRLTGDGAETALQTRPFRLFTAPLMPLCCLSVLAFMMSYLNLMVGCKLMDANNLGYDDFNYFSSRTFLECC